MVMCQVLMNFNTERFIAEIEKKPAIWDKSSNDYTNRDLKIKCWKELTKLFAEENMSSKEKTDLNVALQKRWKGIRSCYAREVKRQKLLSSGYPDVRKSQYVFFNNLHFLNKEGNEEDDGTLMADQIEKNRESKRKIDAATPDNESKEDTLLNRSFTTKRERGCDEDDEDRMFLLSLLNTLREVPRDRKIIAKIRMMSVLEGALKNNAYELPLSVLSSFTQTKYVPERPLILPPEKPEVVDFKPHTKLPSLSETSISDDSRF